ncbi:hypothetical protein [uncultured Aquimarina sp.]|uniref:hypothetical protein n=1 Tax=uncultured Aquimarina sp. TaxID=575652 RepID=UPI00260312C0|nr:hypothetical protein [uncultured Aquimarina sp.]
MKRIIIYCLILLITSSCKAQSTVIDLDSKDLIVFEFNYKVELAKFYTKVYNEDGTFKKEIESSENKEVYNKQKTIIITQEWQGYGSRYFDKKYLFIRNQDTMAISCNCGQEANFYFKDISFQKGHYELQFEQPKLTIKGSELADKNLNKLILKNAYIREGNSTVIKQAPFKKLDFYEISLNDNGVTLKQIN